MNPKAQFIFTKIISFIFFIFRNRKIFADEIKKPQLKNIRKIYFKDISASKSVFIF